ncbi:MAG: hypothetical protein MJZ34_01555 [Paludibacteraceae bacterium]|nr:hypothetical protein [Paludibacteraceae bacterium]
MKTLFDHYVMLNYIIYKFYRRYEKEELDARLTSHLLSSLLLWLSFDIIDALFCIFSYEYQLATHQENRLVYAIPLLTFAVINYLLLYRGGRYKEEFMKLDKISDTEEFAKRKRNTKIYIIVLIIIQVILQLIISYVNKSRF